MTEINKGDRVKVTFEAEYKKEADGLYYADELGGGWFVPTSVKGLVIEKIEPPIVTFGPGDIVRNRVAPGMVYAITATGFVPLHNQYGQIGTDRYRDHGFQFESDRYEKVGVGE